MSRYVSPGRTSGGRFCRSASHTVSRRGVPKNSTFGFGTASKRSSLAVTVAVIERSASSGEAGGRCGGVACASASLR